MDKITDIMNQMVKAMIEQDVKANKIMEVRSMMEIVLNKYNKAV